MTRQDCPRPLPSPMARLVMAVIALVLAVGLGIAAHGSNVLDVDLEVTTWVQQLQGGVVRTVADVANILGSTGGASVVIALAIVIAAIRRARWELLYLIALIVFRLLGTQLKPLFDSPRPTDDLVTLTDQWDSTGYPSGHALTAATMALGLAVIAWRRIPSRKIALGSIAVLVVLMLLIGWARIWSGAHWMTDVIGGYAFGLAFVPAATAVPSLILRRDAASDRGDNR
jgi:membrane-associated phospholipid phosphatase